MSSFFSSVELSWCTALEVSGDVLALVYPASPPTALHRVSPLTVSNARVRVGCSNFVVLHPSCEVLCDIQWEDVVDIKQRSTFPRSGDQHRSAMRITFGPEAQQLVLEAPPTAISAVLKAVHWLAGSSRDDRRIRLEHHHSAAEAHAREASLSSGAGMASMISPQLLSPQGVAEFRDSRTRQLLGRLGGHPPATRQERQIVEESEQVELVRRRERQMREDIAPPVSRSSSARSGAAALPLRGGSVDPETVRRRRAAAHRRGDSVASSSASSDVQGISSVPKLRSASVASQEVVERIRREVREDSMRREASRSVSVTSPGDTRPIRSAGNVTREHVQRDVNFLMSQIEHNEVQTRRAIAAQLHRLGITDQRSPSTETPAPLARPPLSPAAVPTVRMDETPVQKKSEAASAADFSPSPQPQTLLEKLASADDVPKAATPSAEAKPAAGVAPPGKVQMHKDTPERPISIAAAETEDDANRNQQPKETPTAVRIESSAPRALAPPQPESVLIAAASSPISPTDDPSRPLRTEGDWKEVRDPSSGKVYFFNSSTKKTTWSIKDTPFAALPIPAVGADSIRETNDDATRQLRACGEWKEVRDPSSGKVYFFNTSTKQTTWSIADTPFATMASVTAPAASPAPKVETEDPSRPLRTEGDWKEVRDPSSGKVYFFNSSTKKTTWSIKDTPFAALPIPAVGGDSIKNAPQKEVDSEQTAKEEADCRAKEGADAKGKADAEAKIKAQKEEADRAAKAKDEADRKAKEEADRKAKEEADRKAKEEADRKAKEEADRKAKDEADRKAKEEADRKAKEEADRKAKDEADRKAKEEADRKAKDEADRKAKEEADRKGKEEADRAAKAKAVIPTTTWKAKKAPDGRTFFINAETKKSVWKLPEGGVLQDAAESSEKEKPKDDSPRAAASSPWRSKTAPDGRTYFVNVDTRKTAWKLPAGATIADQSAAEEQNDAAPGGEAENSGGSWVSKQAPNGKTYYVNLTTRATVWKLPEGATVAEPKEEAEPQPTEDAEPQPKEEEAAKIEQPRPLKHTEEMHTLKQPPEKAAAKIPAGDKKVGPKVVREEGPWQELQDPSTGKIYYYNKDKKKTQKSSLGTPWAPSLE